MVFEILGVNFLEIIKRYDYKGVPLPLVRKLTRQCLVGLDYMHRMCKIIHTDFKASVVSDSSNTMGILSWKGGSEGFAQVEHIPISSRLKINERMLTSDFSTFAIRGVPVGRVARIKPDKLFYNIDLRLAVDFSSLTYVLVAPLKIEPEKVVILNDSTATQVP
jgi:rod shape-determining protein MreC